MKTLRNTLLIVVSMLMLVSVTGCFSDVAAKPGVWYNPLSWGDQTAEQTATEILAEAQAQKTIRDAQAAATAMAGGTIPTAEVVNATPEVVVQNPTPQPGVPTVTLAPPPAPAEEAPAQQGCHVIHESVLVDTMDHVSTSGSHIHVEYWFDGQPERETVLDASQAAGGAFDLTRNLRGWVWEYDGCTTAEVEAQAEANVVRRLEGGFDNDGFYAYGETHTGVWDPNALFLPR